MTGPRRADPPGVPSEIREWSRRYGGLEADTTGAAAVEAALRALGEALSRPGRDRRAAHALLAADALLTSACEEAATGDDPEGGFLRLLDRLREEGR